MYILLLLHISILLYYYYYYSVYASLPRSWESQRSLPWILAVPSTIVFSSWAGVTRLRMLYFYWCQSFKNFSRSRHEEWVESFFEINPSQHLSWFSASYNSVELLGQFEAALLFHEICSTVVSFLFSWLDGIELQIIVHHGQANVQMFLWWAVLGNRHWRIVMGNMWNAGWNHSKQ